MPKASKVCAHPGFRAVASTCIGSRPTAAAAPGRPVITATSGGGVFYSKRQLPVLSGSAARAARVARRTSRPFAHIDMPANHQTTSFKGCAKIRIYRVCFFHYRWRPVLCAARPLTAPTTPRSWLARFLRCARSRRPSPTCSAVSSCSRASSPAHRTRWSFARHATTTPRTCTTQAWCTRRRR